MTTVLPVSALMGDKVVNRKGQTLGRIEDLVIDLATGDVMYAILGLGASSGSQSQFVAVPWSLLEVDAEIKRIVLAIPRRELERAPRFVLGTSSNMAESQWQERVNAHFAAVIAEH